MNATKAKRVSRRIIAIILLAFLLASVVPLALNKPIMEIFFVEESSIKISREFAESLLWCHVIGIAALLALNLVFFARNEKKGDSGFALRRRNALQGWLNFLLIVLTVTAMIVIRYVVTSDPLIGVHISTAWEKKLMLLSPFLAFAASGIVFCCFCMRAAPATNCVVSCLIARKIDDNIKHAVQNR